MNKKKKELKKKNVENDVVIDVALPEYSNNKCYISALTFRYR